MEYEKSDTIKQKDCQEYLEHVGTIKQETINSEKEKKGIGCVFIWFLLSVLKQSSI